MHRQARKMAAGKRTRNLSVTRCGYHHVNQADTGDGAQATVLHRLPIALGKGAHAGAQQVAVTDDVAKGHGIVPDAFWPLRTVVKALGWVHAICPRPRKLILVCVDAGTLGCRMLQ